MDFLALSQSIWAHQFDEPRLFYFYIVDRFVPHTQRANFNMVRLDLVYADIAAQDVITHLVAFTPPSQKAHCLEFMQNLQPPTAKQVLYEYPLGTAGPSSKERRLRGWYRQQPEVKSG